MKHNFTKYCLLLALAIIVIILIRSNDDYNLFYNRQLTYKQNEVHYPYASNIKLKSYINSKASHQIENYYPTQIILGPKADNFDEPALIDFSYQHTFGKEAYVYPDEFQPKYWCDIPDLTKTLLEQELVKSPQWLDYQDINPIMQFKKPTENQYKYDTRENSSEGDGLAYNIYEDPNYIARDIEAVNDDTTPYDYKHILFHDFIMLHNLNKALPVLMKYNEILSLYKRYQISAQQNAIYKQVLKKAEKYNDKYHVYVGDLYHNNMIVDGYDCFNHLSKQIINNRPAYKLYGYYISNIYANNSPLIPQAMWMYNTTKYPKLPIKTRLADNANKVAWCYDDKTQMSYYRDNLNHWLPGTFIAKLDNYPAILIKNKAMSLHGITLEPGMLYYGKPLLNGSGKYNININGKVEHIDYKTLNGQDYVSIMDPIDNKVSDYAPVSAIKQFYGRKLN